MQFVYSKTQKVACLSALFLAWAVGYADRILISTAIIPISHEFSLDARQAGLVLSIFYISYALTQLVGGWLSDRYGSRIIVVLCIVLWSVFTGVTSLAWSFTSLLVIRFLFGAGEGSFSPASSVTVAEVFPKPERARAKSFLISTVFLGNAIGSGVIGLAVAYLGWRSAFHILADTVVGAARRHGTPARKTYRRHASSVARVAAHSHGLEADGHLVFHEHALYRHEFVDAFLSA